MGLLDRLRGDDDRVAFIGIDGVPYSLIEDHEEVFPNLHAIMDDGSAGAIDSIVPPESSACWPALTTGVNPGTTGVYGFQDRKVDSYETYIPMGSHVEATRVWDRVSEAGRAASVVNVPVTFPPQSTVQRMVSGFLSPSVEDATHPAAFKAELSSMGYRIDVDASLGHDEDKTAFIEDAYETLEGRFNAFEHVFAADDWDLFFGVFMTTDRVNHFLFEDYEHEGEYHEAFLEFYGQLDEYIGRLNGMLDADTDLIIAADHGFTTLEHEVHLNAWLEQEGWLSFESDEPEELGDIADETRAYALIPGRLYLNLEGREPRGSVPESEYEATREELLEDLAGMTGPDGKPVCERIVKGEEVFSGVHTEIAPDLVVIPNRGFDLKAGFKGDDTVFDTSARNGMHTFDNAAFVSDIEGLDLSGADLYDIAPTILDRLDLSSGAGELEGASLVR